MNLDVGRSTAASDRAAVAEAVRDARQGGRAPAFAIVFATVQYDPRELAASVSAELGDVPWAGCFSAGVIAHGDMLERGVVVGLVSGDGVRAGFGVGGPLADDPRQAGEIATEQAFAALPALSTAVNRTVIVLPNAATSRATDVVRGAAQHAGTGVYWAGGGTGSNFGTTRHASQILNGKAYEDHVVVVAIDSPKPVGVGVRHGWLPYGPACMVTRAEGQLVYELDFARAFDVYCGTAERLGDDVTREGFPSFATMHPLGIPQPFGGHLIRDPLEADADGSLRCVGEVPDGSIVRMMVGSEEGLLEAARAAAAEAIEEAGCVPHAAFLFDCFSRYVAFGNSLDRELTTIRRTFGEAAPMIGCLTMGEVATFDGSVPQFHNKTAVVLGFA